MSPKADDRPIVGMDLGGTKILAAVMTPDGKLLTQAKNKTRAHRGVDAVIAALVSTAEKAIKQAGLRSDDIQAIGVGAPGPVDPSSGIVSSPPNLPGWETVELGPRLANLLNAPVYVDNDVNLGTLGEYTFGAGRGTRDMLGVFVGTGVGGGLILNGRLHRGFRNSAGELGHMIVQAEGPVCGCGNRGCLESVASRTAIERDIRLGLAAGRTSLLSADLDSKNRLTSGTLANALRQQDPLVSEVMFRAQRYLGLLTASIVNLLDPEMVVFGGGVVEALGEDFVAPIRVIAQQHYIQKAEATQVRIVPAALGDHAGVLGALALCRVKEQ